MSTTDYALRPMTDADVTAVLEFLAANFQPDDPQNRPGWLQWHRSNPNGGFLQLITKNQDIAALSVFLPMTLCANSVAYSGAFSVSTMVSPDHRRKGLGGKIHSERLERFDFALSSGQSVANRRLYQKMGFGILGEYRFMLAVKQFPKPSWAKQYAHELASWLKLKSHLMRGQTGVRIEELDTLPEHIPDAFFSDRMPGENVMCPRHSRDYVQWRYADHPYFSYRFLAAYRKSELIGLSVVRDNGVEMILADIYCRYSDTSTVVKCVIENMGAKRLYCRFVGSDLDRALCSAGCYTRAQGNAYLGRSLDADIEPFTRDRQWCLFMGDSDEDR